MMGWFAGIKKAVFRCKLAVCSLDFEEIGASGTEHLVNVAKRALLGALTCFLALGGAIVGTILGAIKGQTTESGFLRGAGIGALAGAVTTVQLLESLVNGESLPKVALILSLFNGKAFMEWVIPAVIKAYQWQISTIESSYGEISDIYDVTGVKGLSQTSIKALPVYQFHNRNRIGLNDIISCAICLQDFKEGECGRKLPICSHLFHLGCIDEWLGRHGSCPMCRAEVCRDETQMTTIKH